MIIRTVSASISATSTATTPNPRRLGLMRNLGPKVAFVAVREGTPVYDADDKRIGVVEEVLADGEAGITNGVVIHTVPLPGRHLVADVDQISALHERGVGLSVKRDALRRPSENRRRPRSEDGLERPQQGALRPALGPHQPVPLKARRQVAL